MKLPRLVLLGCLVLAVLGASRADGVDEDSPTLAALARDLQQADGNTRRKAAESLGDFPEPEAVRLLIEAYRAEKQDAFGVKAACAEALGKTGHEQAAVPLGEILSDPDYWVRKKAAEALGTIPGEEATAALIRAMQDEDPRVRAQAVLSTVPQARAPDTVRKALEDPDERVVVAALEALDGVDHPDAEDSLLRGLTSSSWRIRYRAAAVLTRRSDPRGAEVLEAAVRGNHHAGAALREAAGAGAAAVPMLAALFADPDATGKDKILEALQAIDDPESTALLSAITRSGTVDMDHRVQAATTLFDRRGSLARGQVEGLVVLLVKEQDANLLGVVLQILMDAGGPEYLGPIAPLAGHENPVVRHFALSNLARYGGPHYENVFIDALSDANGANVRLSLEALGKHGTATALPALRSLTENRKHRRFAQAAIDAIEARQ